MIPFNQDNINKLTNFILNKEATRILALEEDWKTLYRILYNEITTGQLKLTGAWREEDCFGFLYKYFLELDDFNLLEHIKIIPAYAFFDDEIENIRIPINIIKINIDAFSGCEMLEEIEYEGTMNDWYRINLPNGWMNYSPISRVKCSDGYVKLK